MRHRTFEIMATIFCSFCIGLAVLFAIVVGLGDALIDKWVTIGWIIAFIGLAIILISRTLWPIDLE